MSRAGQRSELVDTKRSIQQILRTEGFKFYQTLVTEQIANRRDSSEQPSMGLDGFIGREFLAGEIHGLRLARDILEGLEASVDEAIALLNLEEEQVNE